MTPLEGGEHMRAGPRRNRARKGSAIALLGALALALISGALLDTQRASAAPAGFSGASLRGLVPTNTPSVTDTPTNTPIATDTPLATATNTPTPAPTATSTPAPTATPRPTPTPFTTRQNVLNITAALAATHQQKPGSNLCGVATITLIANYLYLGSATQDGIAATINDPSSTSEWGAPTPTKIAGFGWRPGFTADIAYDFGTDPRSIAYGLTAATGWQYHAKVDTTSAWDATIHIVDDMINTQQPISVTVDHGLHSVVVYGVETAKSTDNPITNPSSITYIDVWDPAGGDITTGIQSSPRARVPLSLWLSGVIPWSGETYFKYPYSSNPYAWGGSTFSLDPDPVVGPYTYFASKKNHLWVGHWVWISSSGGGGLNADWELNQYGALIRGVDGSGFAATPMSYTGPSVPMPNDLPPPPPPVRRVYIVSLPKPHPRVVPKPTPTPRPTATPRPTPRLRSSPTPDLPWPTQQPPSDPPPVQLACVASLCMPNPLTPGWLVGLAALLLSLALLLSGWMMARRRRRLAVAGVSAGTDAGDVGAGLAALSAGEGAPTPVGLMWLADETPTAPDLAPPEEAAPAEEAASPEKSESAIAPEPEPPTTLAPEPSAASEPDPLIVPVLEADAAPPPADEAPPEGQAAS